MIEVDRIYNQDCLFGLKQLPNNFVDLVVTDPPYVIQSNGGGIYTQKHIKYMAEIADMKCGFPEAVLDELCRVMKRINIYLFCSQQQILPLTDYFVNRRHCNWNLLCWHKQNPVPACGNKYLTDTEYILFFREKGVEVFGTCDTKRTYYVTPINSADKKKFGHPTVKPIHIVMNLILNSSRVGDVVLDPFLGSGTTAVAALNTGRHYIGYEKRTDYFEIAKNRIDYEKNLISFAKLNNIFEWGE